MTPARLALALPLLLLAALVLALSARAQPPPQPPFIAAAQAELAHPDKRGPDPFLSTCLQAAPAAASRNVNLITGDATNRGYGLNHRCLTPQNEPAVAVDPLDPAHLVAGANDYRDCCVPDGEGHQRNDGGGYAYVSRDGGRSWLNVRLPGVTRTSGGRGRLRAMDSAGDPAVAFAPDGTVYYANIAFSRTGSQSAILLSVSRDGGSTWARPRIVRYDNTPLFFNDKEAITVGPDGRVYVTWTRFAGDFAGNLVSAYIVVRASGDRGAHWSPLRVVSPRHLYAQGSQPQVAADGTVEVAYEAASPLANYAQDAIVVARSTDAGASWREQEVARVYDDWNCYPVDPTSGRQILSGEEFRINSFPSFAVDPSTGAAVIAWSDDQGAGNCGVPALNPAAFFAGTSSNQVKVVAAPDGRHFGPARVVSAGADTAMPAAATRDGVTVVSYYIRDPSASLACAPDGETSGYPACLGYAYRSSRDGYTVERLLSDAPSNPFVQFGGQFLGDYTALVIGRDGVAHALWTDSRGSTAPNQDIYAANFTP